VQPAGGPDPELVSLWVEGSKEWMRAYRLHRIQQTLIKDRQHVTYSMLAAVLYSLTTDTPLSWPFIRQRLHDWAHDKFGKKIPGEVAMKRMMAEMAQVSGVHFTWEQMVDKYAIHQMQQHRCGHLSGTLRKKFLEPVSKLYHQLEEEHRQAQTQEQALVQPNGTPADQSPPPSTSSSVLPPLLFSEFVFGFSAEVTATACVRLLLHSYRLPQDASLSSSGHVIVRNYRPSYNKKRKRPTATPEGRTSMTITVSRFAEVAGVSPERVKKCVEFIEEKVLGVNK
jgi:hypothetical protein